ncbi:MAG: zinc ribbon domain-containing protein [bacterium]|nr:zinc ribbon domain-containing protein [bacterium]
MPLFEYICADCGNEFEELVSSSEQIISCPKCNSHSVERKLSVFAASSSGSSSSMPFGAPSAGSCGSGGFT